MHGTRVTRDNHWRGSDREYFAGGGENDGDNNQGVDTGN